MNIIKIIDGRIHQVNERGIALHPVICRNVVSAFYNSSENLIVVTFSDGMVQLVNLRGIIERTIVKTGAANALFSGQDILVQTIKGKTEIRSQTGLLIRTV